MEPTNIMRSSLLIPLITLSEMIPELTGLQALVKNIENAEVLHLQVNPAEDSA